MTQSDSGHNKASGKSVSGAQQRASEQQKAAAQLRERREQQFATAKSAIEKFGALLQTTRREIEAHKALSNHLEGFYDEIDKLTKGKTLLEVTDLIVEQANAAVRDSKAMVNGDPYLDRIREFVPAGNNPVYPDVLLTLRTIQQSLVRYGARLKEREDTCLHSLKVSRTIGVALEYYLRGLKNPQKDAVQEGVGTSVADDWFSGGGYGTSPYFDFEKLDRIDLKQYLP